jgi:hypothetical protein
MELEKNVRLDSSKLNVKAKTKLWWICANGHEWSARLDHRKEVPVVHMIQVNGSCLVIALQILFPKFKQ